MTRSPEQTWQEYLQIWNGERPIARLPDLLAPDYIGYAGAAERDTEALALRIAAYRLDHPGARFEVLEVLPAGDRLVTRLRATGLTGTNAAAYGINISQYADGLLFREWAVWEAS